MADLVPYHDRDGSIWFDGKLVPWRDAQVHVLTHALHYASAVFEGERAYDGEIFKLTEHTERLIESGKVLDFDIPYTVAEIDQACRDTIAANNLSDCYVRPIAWRGSEQMGVSAQSSKIHLAVAAWNWGSYFPMEQRLKGIRITHAQYRRPDPAIQGFVRRSGQLSTPDSTSSFASRIAEPHEYSQKHWTEGRLQNLSF